MVVQVLKNIAGPKIGHFWPKRGQDESFSHFLAQNAFVFAVFAYYDKRVDGGLRAGKNLHAFNGPGRAMGLKRFCHFSCHMLIMRIMVAVHDIFK